MPDLDRSMGERNVVRHKTQSNKRQQQTEYTRVRVNIMAYRRRYARYGIDVVGEIPLTEHELRASGISKQKLAAETRKLKKEYAEIKAKGFGVVRETGEVIPLSQFRKETKAFSRKNKTKKVTQFSDDTETEIEPEKKKKEKTPQLEDETKKLPKHKEKKSKKKKQTPKESEINWQNFVDAFLDKIGEPAPDYRYTAKGRYRLRTDEEIDNSNDLLGTISELVYNLLEKEGVEKIGKRLAESDWSNLVSIIQYGYKQQAQAAAVELLTIIKGTDLNLSERMAVSDAMYYNEDFYEYDEGEIG